VPDKLAHCREGLRRTAEPPANHQRVNLLHKAQYLRQVLER
jgi:hypothetical protein